MLHSNTRRESQALTLRIQYELGLISKEKIQEVASQWSPEERQMMRDLYRQAVKSVTRTPGPAAK
jgi:hypothetical protein